jgi:phospholipid transport system substrate-binding protein
MTRKIFAVLSTLAFLTAVPAHAEGDAAAPIRILCDRLLEVMKQSGELGFHGREAKLRPVIGSVYDMHQVTKNTLGLAANKLSPDETKQLADAYGRFSAATYADQFNSYGGERFEIESPRPATNGMMVVTSYIIGSDGSKTEIDYLVHENGGAWQIVDVLFEGSVSQVAVRRSEFVPIFRQKGVDALIAMLDTKSQALGKK